MTYLPTYKEFQGKEPNYFLRIDNDADCQDGFKAGQASAQPIIEDYEAEIENLEGFLVLSDDAVRAKTEEITLDKAKVNALTHELKKARASLFSIRRIAEDIDLRRDAKRSVERIHHIVIDGITRSDPS